MSYDIFGNALPVSADGTEVDLRFPGQYYDAETGLYYNYFRYYDPGTGRYITSDPIGLDGGLNTYGYAEQNQVLYADPLGLISTLELCKNPRNAKACKDAGIIPKKSPIKPRKDKGKWRCAVVACCNDNIPGNCPKDPKQWCKQAVWSSWNRPLAINTAEKIAKIRFGCQAKHVTVKCTGPKGQKYTRGGK